MRPSKMRSRHRRRRRIVGLHRRAAREQPLDDRNRRRLAHVVGARLERQPPHRDRPARQIAEVLLDLVDQPLLLQVVDVFDRAQNLEVVALVGGRLQQRLRVLGKAAAAVADAGKQERRADAPVGADRLAHVIDVGADQLADVGDLVHERDARRENRVRRVLAQLGARRAHHQDRRAGPRERTVELLHQRRPRARPDPRCRSPRDPAS